MTDDDKKIPIPGKFRISTNPADEEAYARLKKANAEQLELSTCINSPFLKSSPNDIQRSKAQITIGALSQIRRTKEQNEQFSECWAALGRYDVAIAITRDANARKRYKQILHAIERDDTEKCPHGDQHKYEKAKVFSPKHNREMSLIACNVQGCEWQNVTESPDHILQHQQSQSKHQGTTAGMSIAQAKQYHTNNVKIQRL